jgi:AcrR family transcriptional regulator
MKARRVQRTERQEYILDAATAVFVQRGFYAARLEEIARAAGLSKRALSRSFQSKDLLIAALLHRFYAQGVQELHLLEGTTASATTRIHLFTRYMVAGLQQMAALLPSYQTASARTQEALREFLQDYFREYRAVLPSLIEAGIERGEIHPIDPEEAALMLAALYEGRALVWLADPTSRDWEVIGERVIQTLLEGLKVREETPAAARGCGVLFLELMSPVTPAGQLESGQEKTLPAPRRT